MAILISRSRGTCLIRIIDIQGRAKKSPPKFGDTCSSWLMGCALASRSVGRKRAGKFKHEGIFLYDPVFVQQLNFLNHNLNPPDLTNEFSTSQLVIVPEKPKRVRLGKWVLTDRYLVGEIDRDDMMIGVRDSVGFRILLSYYYPR